MLLKYCDIFRCPCPCPCPCVHPGGRPGPRRTTACRPPPCEAAAGLYLGLLFSLSSHLSLYSSIVVIVIVIVIVLVIYVVIAKQQLHSYY